MLCFPTLVIAHVINYKCMNNVQPICIESVQYTIFMNVLLNLNLIMTKDIFMAFAI